MFSLSISVPLDSGPGTAHLKRDGTRVIYDVDDFELGRRRDELLCTETTRNASSYLERLESGVDRDDMCLPLISRASRGSQPSWGPPKVSTSSTARLRIN